MKKLRNKQKNKNVSVFRIGGRIGLGFLCAFFVSCSSSEIEVPGTDPKPVHSEIGFQVWNIESKAQTITDDNLVDIAVFGYGTGQTQWASWDPTKYDELTANYFCNVKLEKATDWKYSPLQYWPDNLDMISFFAYSPYNTVEEGGESGEGEGDATDTGLLSPYPAQKQQTGKPTVTYKASRDIQKQVDLLWSNRLDMKKGDGKVSFKEAYALKHALTRLNFSARLAKDEGAKGYKATITKISISGVQEQGALSLENGGWELAGGVETGEIYVMDGANVSETVVIEVTDPDTQKPINCLSETAGSLMLIPQELDEDAVLRFYLKIVNPTGDETIESYYNVPLADYYEWKSGRSIDYQLVISEDYILIEVSARSWQDQNADGEIDL